MHSDSLLPGELSIYHDSFTRTTVAILREGAGILCQSVCIVTAQEMLYLSRPVCNLTAQQVSACLCSNSPYTLWQRRTCQPERLIAGTAQHNSPTQAILHMQWQIQTVTILCTKAHVDQDDQYLLWQLTICLSFHAGWRGVHMCVCLGICLIYLGWFHLHFFPLHWLCFRLLASYSHFLQVAVSFSVTSLSICLSHSKMLQQPINHLRFFLWTKVQYK